MCWNWFSLEVVTLPCQNTHNMECGKVVVTPGYPFGLDLIVGRYQQKLQHILITIITSKLGGGRRIQTPSDGGRS